MTPNIPEAIRGNDIGDAMDSLWANAFGTVAGAPSGLSPSVSGKAAHQLSQEHRSGGTPNKLPPSNS
jgi:hypothetical protein